MPGRSACCRLGDSPSLRDLATESSRQVLSNRSSTGCWVNLWSRRVPPVRRGLASGWDVIPGLPALPTGRWGSVLAPCGGASTEHRSFESSTIVKSLGAASEPGDRTYAGCSTRCASDPDT